MIATPKPTSIFCPQILSKHSRDNNWFRLSESHPVAAYAFVALSKAQANC